MSMTIKEDRYFQSCLLFGSDKLNLSFDLRTLSLCPFTSGTESYDSDGDDGEKALFAWLLSW